MVLESIGFLGWTLTVLLGLLAVLTYEGLRKIARSIFDGEADAIRVRFFKKNTNEVVKYLRENRVPEKQIAEIVAKRATMYLFEERRSSNSLLYRVLTNDLSGELDRDSYCFDRFSY